MPRAPPHTFSVRRHVPAGEGRAGTVPRPPPGPADEARANSYYCSSSTWDEAGLDGATLWRLRRPVQRRNGIFFNCHKIRERRGRLPAAAAAAAGDSGAGFSRSSGPPSIMGDGGGFGAPWPRFGMAFAKLYRPNPNSDSPYPQICIGVTTLPNSIAPNQTVAAFLDVPTTFRVRAEVLLITAQVLMFTQNPRVPANMYNSGNSSILANRLCSTTIRDSNTTIPHKSQNTVVGAMTYKPSIGLNDCCCVITCMITTLATSHNSAPRYKAMPVLLNATSPYEAAAVPRTIRLTEVTSAAETFSMSNKTNAT
mmetsp:Transcript_19817/g.43340  ORF Transcript_19817/g.43340 Transcript_19817/m.43340 type:complete len:310 (+) Transcript_19817:639-1568(+)